MVRTNSYQNISCLGNKVQNRFGQNPYQYRMLQWLINHKQTEPNKQIKTISKTTPSPQILARRQAPTKDQPILWIHGKSTKESTKIPPSITIWESP